MNSLITRRRALTLMGATPIIAPGSIALVSSASGARPEEFLTRDFWRPWSECPLHYPDRAYPYFLKGGEFIVTDGVAVDVVEARDRAPLAPILWGAWSEKYELFSTLRHTPRDPRRDTKNVAFEPTKWALLEWLGGLS